MFSTTADSTTTEDTALIGSTTTIGKKDLLFTICIKSFLQIE
jgi:hypothetical protein